MVIRELLREFLPAESVEASFEIMGLDTQLIDDGTYFVVEDNEGIAGCGGWSRRATLFGGDHSVGRDNALLNLIHKEMRLACGRCIPTRYPPIPRCQGGLG